MQKREEQADPFVPVDTTSVRAPRERPSGSVPRDEPEHGTPPIVIKQDSDDRVVGPKNDDDAAVDEAAEQSFPASDPPAWPSSGRDHPK